MKNRPPRDSIIDRSNEQTDIDSADHAIALTAFQRLRSVESVKIYIDIVYETDKHLTYNMETLLVEKESFGTYLNAEDPWDDKNIQLDIDQMFMDLDLELDMLPGFTASMMCLDRFSSWYTNGLGSESKYEIELERMLKIQSPRVYCRDATPQISLRYVAMRTFIPRSLYQRYREPLFMSGKDVRSELTAIREAIDAGSIKEEWDWDTWHNGCYPSGIPAFDQHQFFRTMWYADLEKEVTQKFMDKLTGCGDDSRTINSASIDEIVFSAYRLKKHKGMIWCHKCND